MSINAAIAMRSTFAHDSPAVRAFFDALVELLTRSGKKPQRRNPNGCALPARAV